MPVGQYLDIGPPISRYLASSFLGRPLHHKFDLIQVGLPLAATGDLNEARPFQLLDELADPRLAHAHVAREPLLAGKATVVVPGVVQEHGIGDFGAQAQLRVLEDEIWYLREAAAHNWVVGRELDIAFTQNVADWSRLWGHALIVARGYRITRRAAAEKC
jgi:hypothetical protein